MLILKGHNRQSCFSVTVSRLDLLKGKSEGPPWDLERKFHDLRQFIAYNSHK